jgi:hypothetical protein
LLSEITYSLVSKIQVKFTAGTVTASTKVINQKAKTLTPVFNEELDMQIDPNVKFVIGMNFWRLVSFKPNSIELITGKGSIAANLDNGVQNLKLTQGMVIRQLRKLI